MSVKIAEITNYSPVFKGLALIILGALAALFYYYMKKKWKEPASFGFLVFLWLAVFIILYGFFILIFRPNWWALPY